MVPMQFNLRISHGCYLNCLPDVPLSLFFIRKESPPSRPKVIGTMDIKRQAGFINPSKITLG